VIILVIVDKSVIILACMMCFLGERLPGNVNQKEVNKKNE
jgi:hypothetical protein